MIDGVRVTNERLISTSGLSLVGALLRKTNLKKRIDEVKLKPNEDPDIKTSEIVSAYIGLLSQGKSHFDNVKEMAADPDFYCKALEIENIPSSETLRQRLDIIEDKLDVVITEENINLLKNNNAILTPCIDEYIALDVDVTPCDNSKTKKEGVSRTYEGFDGYAPILAYIGAEGYLINAELRPGSQHCQKNTVQFLEKIILLSKKLTNNPLLVRMDSGNDSKDNIVLFSKKETACDYIIKRNIRSEGHEMWLDVAKDYHKKNFQPRDGKSIYTGSVQWLVPGENFKKRVVFEVIERTIKADGQCLLIPDIEVNTWWTSLDDYSEEVIIELYHAHGTSEQFHSEIKHDMDLERFPSGRFKTNSLVLKLAIIAYNTLLLIGQMSLNCSNGILRNNVSRRRIKTVIQNLILIASRVVSHARKTYLNLGCSNAWIPTFKMIYELLE